MNASPLPNKKTPAGLILPLPFWLQEFSLIRRAVLSCLATIVVSVGAVVVSAWYLDDARTLLAQAQQQRMAAYSKFAQVESEKQDIRTYQPQFMALRKKGIIGDENRLSWLDAIRQVQEDRRLFPLFYEIDPQQSLSPEKPASMNAYQLRSSRMRVHLDLMHEMDLFHFIQDLQQRSFFAVQDCMIKRPSGAALLPDAPILGADCTFNWLTLTPASALPPSLPPKAKR